MSSIAKVFIIINFVLSVLFLGVSASFLSQHWDYRQSYLEAKHVYRTDIEQRDNELKQEKEGKDQLRALLSERTKSTKDAQDEIENLKQQNNRLTEDKQDLSNKLKSLTQSFNQISDTVKNAESEKEKLKAQAKDAEQRVIVAESNAKAAYEELSKKEIELNELSGRLVQTEKMLKRSSKELWEAKQIVRSVRELNINLPSVIVKTPPIDGQILAVDAKVPLVMLSVGKDDGVEKGFQFTVYRENRYVGRVTIQEVYKDMSAAQIDPSMTVKAIQKGDSVTTKIGGGSF
jgi:hypothetical protein